MYFILSFFAGFCGMSFEIIAARYLFPSFGSTVDTWSIIIAVFIGLSAIGNIFANHLKNLKNIEDKYIIPILLLVWSFWVFVVSQTGWESSFFINKSIDGFILLKTFFAALYIFAIPCFIYGLITPLSAVYLHKGNISKTVGYLNASGSIGSIVGIIVFNQFLSWIFTVDQCLQISGFILITLASYVFYKVKKI